MIGEGSVAVRAAQFMLPCLQIGYLQSSSVMCLKLVGIYQHSMNATDLTLFPFLEMLNSARTCGNVSAHTHKKTKKM